MFAKCEKLSFWGGKIWFSFKRHCKIDISTHFKAKTNFEGLLSGPIKGYYLVQDWPFFKMANLDQIIILKMLARHFLTKLC